MHKPAIAVDPMVKREPNLELRIRRFPNDLGHEHTWTQLGSDVNYDPVIPALILR